MWVWKPWTGRGFLSALIILLFKINLAASTGLTCRRDLEELLGQPPQSFFSQSDPAPSQDFAVSVNALRGVLDRLLQKKVDPHHAPYVLTHNRKTKRVVVIVHGLLGTPLQMYPLAHAYFEKGYNVVVTLLDGHAVSRTELHRLSLDPKLLVERFKDSLKFTVDLSRLLGDEIIVSGFSLGGALGLKTALTNEIQPVALGLLAPALKEHPFARRVAKPKYDKYFEWRTQFSDALKSGLFLETQNPYFWSDLPGGVSETEFLGGAYSRMPTGALALIPELSNRLLPQIEKHSHLALPMHLTISEADYHVDFRALDDLAGRLDVSDSTVLRFTKSQNIAHLDLLLGKDSQDQFLFQSQVEWMASHFPPNE